MHALGVGARFPIQRDREAIAGYRWGARSQGTGATVFEPARAFTNRVAVALLLLLLSIGCASFEAARLYKSGSEALEQGEVERAIADLERAAELAPNASEVRNHLGLALAADGREEAALLEFERAVELDCENEAAQENLAVTRVRLGIQGEAHLEGALATGGGR